ncbi:MAG: hypothetical protein NC334_09050 [Bacteroides sp.]|nr:hypothetical protein [Bacteroides sp.]
MECPKCHTKVKEGETVCPKCKKVLALKCPNCGTLGNSSVCEKCGYTILVKCSKCAKLTPFEKEICTKCKFPLSNSLAYQECESDDFASIVIQFGSLKKIRKTLKSQELYTKFYYRLKNLLLAQIKGVDCKFITYGNTFTVNMCKELSFATSSNKAIRLALKIVNAFVSLNTKVMEELGTPLNLSVSINKKSAENLQELTIHENNVKLLTTSKGTKKYLKGLEIVLDQFVRDEINKEYKTDSLYSVEENGKTIMFYEILLDTYVLPPSEKSDDAPLTINKSEIKKKSQEKEKQDIHSFKVFDINAKCTFERLSGSELINSLNNKLNKIISIRAEKELQINTSSLTNFFKANDYNVITVSCTEEMSYKPWGFFETLFKDYFGLSCSKELNDLSKINPAAVKTFKPIFDLIFGIPVKAMTPEDARFTYMESWNKFLSLLDKTVILVEGFEQIDDTSIQTLELYFDKFKRVKPNFVFITEKECSAHHKIKGLLRTPIYTEYVLNKTSIDSCIATFKSDAKDFINSFYFEKIQENFNGSYLYFENAISFLKECGILVDFDNKLLIKSKKAVILPANLQDLYKSRIKHLSKNMDLSLIFAYSTILGSRMDFKVLEALGIKDVEKHAKTLVLSALARSENGIIYLNNFNLILPVIQASLKKAAEEFLAKNILTKLAKGIDNASMAFSMGKLGGFKEEYLTLWKNSQFAINTGDYDAYLKNCLGFLSLVEHIESNISKEEIEDNKKEVYNNVLMSLYSYSPAKIYFIENMLLMDAINEDDNDKIVKLSNLMLQGALISSNYTDALGLLHNILSRMPNPTLMVNGAVNTKFLLLSLVHIEILYNVGDYRTCVDTTEEILSVLSPEILDKIKPASFSTNLFVSHLLETCRLAGFAKLFLMDENLEEYFARVAVALNSELPEAECILAVRDFLADKVYTTGNIEEVSAFSKVVYLILQELSVLKDDYKRFAQNIYQAKLLALDLHQKELELFCDLLIAYSYSKIGIKEKAIAIYNDVLETADKSAMFNIRAAAKYFKALVSAPEEALLLVNDTLAAIQKFDNQAQILYAMFEKLYIDIAEKEEITAIDIETEKQKLEPLNKNLKRILG